MSTGTDAGTAGQPALETARLLLRPARPADLDALHALWSDVEVRRFLFDDEVVPHAQAAEVLDACLALAPQGLGLWVLEPRDAEPAAMVEGEALGCAGLLPVTTAASHEPRLAGLVEALLALSPAAWGRGYAQEALAALLRHAAGTLALRRLAGVTDVPNAASDRMLRRAGFTVLGEVPGPRHTLRTYTWEAPGS